MLDELIRRTAQQAAAFNAGDMKHWYRLTRPSQDFTLLQPFGGPAQHGFDGSAAHLDQLSKMFRKGAAALEIQQTYVSDNLIVLVFIERQHGEVGDLPDQDWSLRVTQVYRRDPQGWELVHRHADPLVRRLSLYDTAALARHESFHFGG